ncbi:excalibur calcium-binding domain-containing protein [Streptomyces sp. NBC_00879]|uniref:excalibur calcium-binding domain-containing protein n=1 Tax=Streptomyces sp. NBC_00879 TaxID=2975855 RepID=UPI003865D149|nr:excalibur calcium-binding domain-containing protein [Streptomyces sp. NBC_00879]
MTNTVTVEPKTSAPEPTTPAPTSPQEPAPTTAADASSIVRQYFAAINARDYRRAWDIGGKNFSDSYASFVDGFAGTAQDTVHILRTNGATVSVTLEATQTDGSLRIFEGTYTVHGGTIVGADVHEVTAPEPQPSESSPYYENCDEAREAGVAPLYEGEPGYAPHLDRDGDGVACEPYVP